MKFTRRSLLAALAASPAIAMTPPRGTAEDIARDESFWASVAAQYDLPEGIVQLENGNWGVMARPVLQAHIQALEMVNREASYYARRGFGADIFRIRNRVAALLKTETSEIVFTRNATEALQALIGGYNTLKPGDHVLYADLDYDSMQEAMDWLTVRRGVEVVRMAMPEPATHQNILDAYEAILKKDGKIRLILLTQISHRTGLMVPVREITEMARRYGADTIVDAAHSWGQVNVAVPDIGADFIGFNLHKWIGAPLGCGLMYIRKTRIADIDPFMSLHDNGIASRVHPGTVNYAAFLAIEAAIDFHKLVGADNKEARLRHLRALWTEPLRDRPGMQILTPADPRLNAGMGAFRLHGRSDEADNIAIAKTLLDRFGIFTVHRSGIAKGACVRATPALFNSASDMLRLKAALETLAKA